VGEVLEGAGGGGGGGVGVPLNLIQCVLGFD